MVIAGDASVQAKADNISLVLYCFSILSAVVQVLQFINQQGSRGEGQVISLSMSISLIALAASVSVALPPRYVDICCRLSFLFSMLSCAFPLSPFVPSKLFWVPYTACVFPLLHLLQLLLPANLQRSLKQLFWATWNAISDAACRAHQAIVGPFLALLPTTSSSVTSISCCSSAAPARIIEEGDSAHVINGNSNNE